MGNITEKYGAFYYPAGNKGIVNKSRPNDLYSYKAFIGDGIINVESGDSLITLSHDLKFALWFAGGDDLILETNGFGVVLRGYKCGDKSVSLNMNVNLPYVNGCATRQIFPPERIGDPTLQQLTIPPHTCEQMHHIHATPRVVYVLKGNGYSIVGQADNVEETKLEEGMVCVLDPMSPHHFRTEDEYLTVLPVHIFSSTANEQNHPMFNGTKEV
tara:strand:+ start:11813 stop:12454 length:642 start_codon:yes stop_codon:yes gene_type:complete